MRAMEISLSGLDVEWCRLEVIAANIANANTTRTATGEPWRAMRLVSGPDRGFAAYLDGKAGSAAAPAGTEVYGLEPVVSQSRRVYEPAHPDADAEGFVTYPGFDHAAEMILMVKTARTYEANLVAMNMARQMYMKAMEIGRR